MLDARFSHLYFRQSLPTLQGGLSAIADVLVKNFSWARRSRVLMNAVINDVR